MKRGILIAVLGFTLSFMFLACRGSSKPPHLGVFLKEGNSYVEMAQFKGGPSSTVAGGIPTAADPHPVIVMWYPEVNLDLLGMKPLGGGRQIRFDVKLIEEGVLEIRSIDPLNPGVYCLAQGNPLMPSALIPHWCFRVGESARSNTLKTSAQSQFEIDSQVVPTEEGIFLVKQGMASRLFWREGPEEGWVLTELMDYWPETTTTRPIVLVQDPDISIGKLRFRSLTVGAGFRHKNRVVTAISRGSGAELGGLRIGDTIIAVDGIKVVDSDTINSRMPGLLGTTAEVTVLRGSATVNLFLKRLVCLEMVDWPYTIVPRGEFVQLISDLYLPAGVYCYSWQSPGYFTPRSACFQIQEAQ